MTYHIHHSNIAAPLEVHWKYSGKYEKITSKLQHEEK
jgi:hypothetical protein